MTGERSSFDPARNFVVLDALRGLCAVLVAVFHFHTTGYIGGLPIVRNAWLFVDFFFVLSGFVIAHSYGDRLIAGQISIARFMGLRMGRIYPLHLAVLAMLLVLELALMVFHDSLGQFTARQPFTGDRSLSQLFQTAFLLNSFGISESIGWHGPSWSIAAEMWTYLLFAIVITVFRQRFLLVTGLIVAATMIWLVVARGSLSATYDWGFIRCVFGFGIGFLTYHLFRRLAWQGDNLAELLVMASMIAFVSLSGYDASSFAAPFVFAICIYVLASESGVVSRLLSKPFFQFLGLTSYSIYMMHVFVQMRFLEVLQFAGLVEVEATDFGGIAIVAEPFIADLATLAMLALLIAAAYVSYRLFEKPGRDLSRRWLAR